MALTVTTHLQSVYKENKRLVNRAMLFLFFALLGGLGTSIFGDIFGNTLLTVTFFGIVFGFAAIFAVTFLFYIFFCDL